MNVEPTDVFAQLGQLHGVANERYLVGRDELRSSLTACTYGSNRANAWIHGPRRIGKTAIAQIIADRSRQQGDSVVWVDAIDLETFDEALARAAGRAAEQGIDASGPTAARQFEALARTSASRPVLVVFDEFDRVAFGMSTPQQALLRRLKSDHGKLSYIFITCLKPTAVVEEVSDIRSRILGICHQPRVVPVQLRHVRELCRRVAEDLCQPELAGDAEEIWRAVGGFPAAVTRAVLKRSVMRHHAAGGEVGIDDWLYDVGQELHEDLAHYWASLSPGSRAFMRKEASAEDCGDALREDGLWNRNACRPVLLVEAGQRWDLGALVRRTPGRDPEELAAVGLLRLTGEINEALRLGGHTVGFRVGDEATQIWRLVRMPCDDDGLRASVGFLYKQYYENARDHRGAGQKPFLLPEPLAEVYRNADVVEAIQELRCTLEHDRTRDSDYRKKNKYYANVGAIYQRYCGRPGPASDEERGRVRGGLVDDLCSLLQDILRRIRAGEAMATD